MTASNRAVVLDLIFGHEGGYTDDPRDPGGPTNFGITLATLAAWRGHPAAADDVKDLTLAEAEQILGSEYLPTVRFDDLPTGLDYAVVDFAVNSGPAQAARTLQRLVGVAADGIIGAKTLAALPPGKLATQKLIDDYCAARLSFMRSLSTWPAFGKGWAMRVADVRCHAGDMVANTPTSMVGQTASPLDSVQAKASPTDVRVSATRGGVAGAVAVVGAVGTAAATTAAQLQPLASVNLVQNIIIGLSVLGAVSGMAVTVARARSGDAT